MFCSMITKPESTETRLLTEMYTDVIADLSLDSQQIQIHFKKEIMELFFSDYFFQQSACILEKWQVIICQFTITNNEVLDGLLRQYN